MEWNKEKLSALFEKYIRKLRITPAWDVKLELVDDPEWRKTGDFKIDCNEMLSSGIRREPGAFLRQMQKRNILQRVVRRAEVDNVNAAGFRNDEMLRRQA